MDVNIPGIQSCDGVVGPTSWDKDIVADVYSLRRADQPSVAGGAGTMTYWWWDINWSEDHVAVHIRRCDLSSTCSSGYLGVQVYGYQHTQGVAPWEGDEGGAVGSTWSRGANPPDQHRACFAPWNRVINTYMTYDCSPWVQVN